MPRLLVNPGTPDAWEIELKSGPNRVGSSENNDFQINHPSISGHHCEFILSDAGVLLRDLGSARGTYINRESVKEAFLQPGQHIQLGAVAMTFSPPVSSSVSDTAIIMVAAPSPPPPTPMMVDPVALSAVSAAFCKNHPEVPARFFCHKCQSHFCDACVATHATDVCAATASGAAYQTPPKDFFARLPASLAYPFRENSLLILIAGTLVFAGLALMSGQIYGVIIQIVALVYVFAFLQHVVITTAVEKDVTPDLPGTGDLLRAPLGLLTTVAFAFGPALVLVVLKRGFHVQIPSAVMWAAVIFGCMYFPMAVLAATAKNSALAANPLTVIPGILKTIAPSLVSIVLMFGIFAAGCAVAQVTTEGATSSESAPSMSAVLMMFGIKAAWSFVTIYLLILNMRILGALYVTRKNALGWFVR